MPPGTSSDVEPPAVQRERIDIGPPGRKARVVAVVGGERVAIGVEPRGIQQAESLLYARGNLTGLVQQGGLDEASEMRMLMTGLKLEQVGIRGTPEYDVHVADGQRLTAGFKLRSLPVALSVACSPRSVGCLASTGPVEAYSWAGRLVTERLV